MLSGLAAAPLPADAVEVGRVLDAWGIKGWVKILPYSASAEALLSCRRWYLLPAEKGPKTFTGCLEVGIQEAREHSDSLVAQIVGVSDRNAAEALRGARLFIERAHFPKTQTDEYYWVDLLGLRVVNRQGEAMGQVRDLMSTGPQTVLVLEYFQDDKTHERLIPFVAAYIDQVDLQGRQILVDWQSDF